MLARAFSFSPESRRFLLWEINWSTFRRKRFVAKKSLTGKKILSGDGEQRVPISLGVDNIHCMTA